MLNVFFYSIILGIIVTILISKIGKLLGRIHYGYDDRHNHFTAQILTFLCTSVWIVILLYIFCTEQTMLGIVRWLWPILIVDIIIWCCDLNSDEEYIKTATILAVISGLFCISTIFAPKQTIVYKHEAKKEMTVSLKEINEKFNLYCYSVASPEMRKIAGKDVAIYQIHNFMFFDETEYIPGYLIQEGDEFPKLISKWIYFDTSYSFKRDALRRIRKEYPTLILGEHKFDVDDDGNPYEVYVYREKFYKSNGEDDYGLVTIDLRDGNCQKYKADEIPEWIDFKSTQPK